MKSQPSLAPDEASTIPETVTVSRLAEILGIAERTVHERQRSGHIVRDSRGRYRLAESIQGYLAYLQNRRTNQHDGDSADGDYEAHRARLTGAKAGMAEIQAETMKAEYHDGGEVEAVWTDMLNHARLTIRAIPPKLARKLAKESNAVKIKAMLEAAVNDALNTLADYDPEPALARYLEAHRGEPLAAAADPETA